MGRTIYKCCAVSLSAAILLACGSYSMPPERARRSIEGNIALDGHDFGVQTGTPYDCYSADEGVTFLLSVNARTPGRISISGEGDARSVDVRLPFSHVTFKRSDCSKLELQTTPVQIQSVSSQTAVTDGEVHVTCKAQGDSADSVDVNAVYTSC